jgi:hypothetical protein
VTVTESGGPPAPLAAPFPEPPAPPGPLRVAVAVALRIAGGVVAVGLAALTGLIEIFYSPLRIGGVLIGASVVLAVVVNYWLPRYTVAVTASGWAALLPPLVWFGLMLVAADRTTEGDLLITGEGWAGLATMFAGSVAFAFGGYRLILPPGPRGVRPPRHPGA